MPLSGMSWSKRLAHHEHLFLTYGIFMQPKDWSIKMNKKERRLATATALQSAAQSITVVDDIKVAPTLQQTSHFEFLMLSNVRIANRAVQALQAISPVRKTA